MSYTPMAAADETDHHSDIENRTNWAGEEKRREVEYITFTQPVSDDTTYPSAPINIGNVGSDYKCEARQLTCNYGTPCSKVYTETWVKKGSWQNVQ